jgi:hypothetical protein
MENQWPQVDLTAMISGKMLSMKNFAVNIIFGGKAWIRGKPRDDQNMTIIAFGGLIFFLGLVGLSALAGSHGCS